MKKIIVALLFLLCFNACELPEKKSNTDLIGTWKMIEILQDPGDGSGTFESVDSQKTITFNTNGTLFSNGNLCDMSTSSNNPSTGTYNSATGTLSPAGCGNSGLPYTYEQNGTILIVNYPCFETCKVKYLKQP